MGDSITKKCGFRGNYPFEASSSHQPDPLQSWAGGLFLHKSPSDKCQEKNNVFLKIYCLFFVIFFDTFYVSACQAILRENHEK